jgi:hypothetical protein
LEPAAACIYCGSTEPNRTDEHSMPEALGARIKLPTASCDSCQKKTSLFERRCTRDMLGILRKHLGIKGKKRRSGWIAGLQVETASGDRITIEAPPEQLPNSAALPAFDLPNLLTGETNCPTEGGCWLYAPDRDTDHPLLDQAGAVRVLQPISLYDWSRMLAKIAHSHAYAMLGPASFAPLLPELILGERDDVWTFVGGSREVMPASKNRLEISFDLAEPMDNGARLLVAHIRIFGDLEAPCYVVTVGYVLDPDLEKAIDDRRAIMLAQIEAAALCAALFNTGHAQS